MGLDRTKILVISSNSFNQRSNNGKTLEAIFSKFAPDEIAQLFFSENESPDWTFCHEYYKITDTDIVKSAFGNVIVGEQKPQVESGGARKRNKLFSILKKLFMSKPFYRELIWRKKYYTGSDLLHWVEKVKPTSLFLLAGDLCFVYDIALLIHHTLNIPLCSYFTDDYIIYPQYKSLAGKIHKKRLVELSNKVIGESTLLFSIGDEMTKEYENRFHRTFYPMMNAIDGAMINRSLSTVKNDCVTISYVGGGSRGRVEALIHFGELLREACPDMDVLFNVFMPDSLDNNTLVLFKKAGIKYRGPVYGDDLQKVKSESDYLLHIESMRKKYYMKTVLSVSTKIPEYLATGKYIIGYGIPWLASMRLLSDNNLGYVLDATGEQQDVINQLRAIMTNPDVSMPARAISYCINRFGKEEVASAFYERIKSIES